MSKMVQIRNVPDALHRKLKVRAADSGQTLSDTCWPSSNAWRQGRRATRCWPLIDVEVTQALRRLVRAGEVSAERAAAAIEDLVDIDLHRHAHLDLLARAWKLRESLTAYDVMYVSLAEALGATVVTCDTRLANAAGHRAQIEVIT